MAACVFAFCFLCGCKTYERTEFFALDTFITLTVEKTGGDVLKKAENLVKGYEDKFSVTKETSEIYRLNAEKSLTVFEDTADLIKNALALCEQTGGALDITVYPLVKAWGFTTGENKVPSSEELSAVLPLVNYRNVAVNGNTVTLNSGMLMDLGAVAKGFITDKLIDLLKENGIESGTVSLGGNVYALGKNDGKDFSIGIVSPFGDGTFCGIRVSDKAVITSGQYQRFFEKDGKTYGHIIDPLTGTPVENEFASVTVIGDNGLLCDALSTALFVMGKDKATEFYRERADFGFIFILKDGSVTISEDIADCFSLADGHKDGKVTVIYKDDKN